MQASLQQIQTNVQNNIIKDNRILSKQQINQKKQSRSQSINQQQTAQTNNNLNQSLNNQLPQTKIQPIETVKQQNQANHEVKNVDYEEKVSPQKKIFEVSFQTYIFSFSLQNSILQIKGQAQFQRQYLHQKFTHETFTEQMKALFESLEDAWSILESAKDKLIFKNKKLYFTILMGQKQKPINIPLSQAEYQDKQYILKLEKISQKYYNLAISLEEQVKKHKLDIKQMNKAKNIEPNQSNEQNLKKFSLQNALGKDQQSQQDPLILYQFLIEQLSQFRSQFDNQVKQIKDKIKNESGKRMIKIKYLALEKKKKDTIQKLQKQKQKFNSLYCKQDIYQHIDELVQFIEEQYLSLGNSIKSMKEDYY